MSTVLDPTTVDVDLSPAERVHFVDDKRAEYTLCGVKAPPGWWHPECADSKGYFPLGFDGVCPSCFRPICTSCYAIWEYTHRGDIR